MRGVVVREEGSERCSGEGVRGVRGELTTRGWASKGRSFR